MTRKVTAARLLDPHTIDARWILTLSCGHERGFEIIRARGVGVIKLPPKSTGCWLCRRGP